MADFIGNLVIHHWVSNRIFTSGGDGRLTCWLINTIAISLRSMNLSKVDSIVDVSVFASTTRKFF